VRTWAVTAAATAILLSGCATDSTARAAGSPSAAGPARSSWDLLPPLDAVQTVILYHLRSDEPLPTEALAYSLPGVCGVEDEEAQQAAVDGAWQRLIETRKKAADRKRWLITQVQPLGGYDLVRGGFPTGLTRDSGPRFGGAQYCFRGDMNYAVALVNWQAFSLFLMPGDQAREFMRSSSLRTVTEDLEVEVAGAERGAIRTLLVRVVRLRIRDAQTGAVLADTGRR
jgi:hypothetical protein